MVSQNNIRDPWDMLGQQGSYLRVLGTVSGNPLSTIGAARVQGVGYLLLKSPSSRTARYRAAKLRLIAHLRGKIFRGHLLSQVLLHVGLEPDPNPLRIFWKDCKFSWTTGDVHGLRVPLGEICGEFREHPCKVDFHIKVCPKTPP